MPEQSLKLKNVINVYQQSYKYYIEIQNVNEGKVAPARPLKKSEFRQLLGTSAKEDYNSLLSNYIIPEHVLSYNLLPYNYYIIWYRKAAEYDMIFKDGEAKMHLPALLFMVKFDRIFVFALKNNKRPESNTELYQAPLFNVASDGLLCLGSMNFESSDSIDATIRSVEYNFWSSVFSHTGSASTKTDLNKLTKQLIRSGDKFPVKELKEANCCLTDLFRK